MLIIQVILLILQFCTVQTLVLSIVLFFIINLYVMHCINKAVVTIEDP